MADYTHVNLKEVEDLAPKFGLAPNMQSRFARQALELTEAGVSHFTIAPDFRLPFAHRHAKQEEVYVLLKGTARLKVEDDVIELKTLDAVRVAATATRGMEAGPEGAEILAFGAPRHGDDDQDAEMVKDWWTD